MTLVAYIFIIMAACLPVFIGIAWWANRKPRHSRRQRRMRARNEDRGLPGY